MAASDVLGATHPRIGRALIGALAAMLALAGPAGAAETPPAPKTPDVIFKACDGYGSPSANEDGITKLRGAWGILPALPANEVRENDTLTMGETGLRACTAALADARISPAIWMRKVSLLRASAMHRLAMNDLAGAFADLDRADAAAADRADPLYARSLGLGVRFVRAFALRLKGDQSGAEKLASEAWRERPYNRQTTLSALIAIGPQAAPSTIEMLNRGLARVFPPGTNAVFAQMFDAGRFADAIAVYPQLTPAKKGNGNSRLYAPEQFQEDETNRTTTELFWAFRSGQAAYAFAALGRGDDARTTIAQARARLEAATRPPPPPVPNADGAPEKPDKHLPQILMDNARIAKSAGVTLDEWASFANFRAIIAEGRTADAASYLNAHPLPRSPYALEAVDALMAKLSPRDKIFAATLASIRQQLAPLRVPATDQGVAGLFAALPDAEGPAKIDGPKKFTAEASPWFADNGAGHASQVNAPATRVTVRAPESSRSIIEEMALLHAADMARASGMKALVIVDARDILQIYNTLMYGQVINSQTNGYQAWLDVVFVDPAAPPPAFKDAQWRFLDADAIHAALAPLYLDRAKAKAP